MPVPLWAWLAAALWIGQGSDFGLQIYDEGSLLVGARSVAHGGVPIRDFWTAYPPGMFWIVGLALRVFGEQIIVNRLLHDAVALGVCVAAYHVMAALAGRGRWALAGFLSIALYIGGLRTASGYPPVLCLLLAFWSLFELLGTGSPPSVTRLRRAGLAAGLCAVFRYDVALYLIAASVGGFLLALAREPAVPGRGQTVRRAALGYLSGFLGPPVLAYLVLVALAGVGPVYTDLIEFPLLVFPRVRSLPLDRPFVFLFTTPRSSWQPTWFLLESAKLLIFVGIAVAVAGALRALARARHAAAPLLLGVSLLALALVNQFRVRSDVSHGWPVTVAGLLIGTVLLAWMTASRHRLVRAAAWVGASICLIVLVPGMAYRGGILLKARYLEPTMAVDSPWAAGIRVAAADTAINALLADLRTRAAGERYLFSGTVDHDQVMFNDALIYFLAGKQSPTPYPELVPGIIDTAVTQREVTQALEAHDVRTAVLFDFVSVEPNDSSRNTHVDVLDRALAAHFQQVAEYPPYKVLRRVDP